MAGIYIHIPFCKQKCTYCDFHFSTTFAVYRDEMITTITTEITSRIKYLEGKTIETIYFGGGTPSLLLNAELKSIMDTIHSNFNVSKNAEVSLEANPDDITNENLIIWRTNGINRLSIGIQSFKKSDLDWMNRAHTVNESLTAIQKAQNAGFENLTADLIYGLPDLTNEEWREHIQKIIDFGVPHISAYNLTVEKGTVLNSWVEKKKIIPANEDQQSNQFNILLDALAENKYTQYEISNFSKSGFESKHNSNYWKGEWYLGVGPSAHSFNGLTRRWNVSNNQKYIKELSNNSYFEVEILSTEDRFNELILTGLRTIYGVDLSALNQICSIDDAFSKKIDSFIENKWLINTSGTLTLTNEGRLLADHISSELFKTEVV